MKETEGRKIDDLYWYGRTKTYETNIRKLKESDISLKNKENIEKFSFALLGNGKTRQKRVGKLVGQLLRVCKILNKDLDSLNLEDIQHITYKINSNDKWSEATKCDYRRAIKQFYYWFEDFDNRFLSDDFREREQCRKMYKFLEKKVSSSYEKKQIDPSQIITEEDERVLLEKGCKSIQEKAIFSTLMESGARTSDLLLTNISSFSVDKRGIGCLKLGKGKTGSREVDLIKCVPYLVEFLKYHKDRENPDSPLFYFEEERNNNTKFMNHSRLSRTIKRIFKRAGINKKNNIHWLRHSKITQDELKNNLPREVRKKIYGWSNKSRMFEQYVHIGRKEVKESWKKANNIKSEEEKEEDRTILCVCQRQISSSLPYCPYCARPNSIEVLSEEKEFQNEINNLIDITPSDKTIRKEYLEVIKYAMSVMNNPDKLKDFNEFRRK